MTDNQPQIDNAELRRRLEEAEETIRAIQSGAVDALVVSEPDGYRVYTLEGADRPYRILVEQMQQGAVTLDVRGRIMYCNLRFAELLETPQPQIIGTDFRDFIPPEEQVLCEEALQQARVGPARCETWLRMAQGTLVPVFLTFNPLPPDAGVAISVLVTDLTAQRHQEKLNATRELLRVTLASIGDAVITTDTDGRVVYLNDTAAQLTGWAHQQVAGVPLETVFQIINEETRAPVENPATRVCQGGCRIEPADHILLVARDGIEWPIEVSSSPIRTEAGETLGAVLVFRDITERRRAEHQIRESQELFAQLADVIPQLAFMTRPDGHVDWYNTRWYEYSGTTQEQMDGWGWQSIHDPEVLPLVIERWNTALATGAPFDMVFPLRGADGEFRPFLTRIAPFRDQQGRIVRWFGTSTDISEQSRIQAELTRTAAELAAADRRKDEFLATLAHELRNPLAPISTGLEAMKHLLDDPVECEEIRSTMERQARQLVHLIDDLLDVSRITQGKLQLRLSRVTLADVVRIAVEATHPFIKEGGHEFTVTLPGHPIILEADSTRLAQIFSNLLTNAAKYTKTPGQIHLTAALQGDEVLVKVQDNGLGIAPEMQGRIFEMFGQIDNSLEGGYTGLGIGLTLVKSLVEMHRGVVTVSSEGVNRGSEFTVRLPVLPESATVASAPVPISDGIARQARLRVLVVDDNIAGAKMIKTVVKILGHEVQTAHDGLEALETAEQFRPDVILMDIGMPKLNGYEAAQRIREQPWGRDMLLVALTGWGQESDRERTREAGFDHHLVKPADSADLKAILASREPVP